MATRADLIIDQGSFFSTTINLSNTDGSLVQLNSPSASLYTTRGRIRKSYDTDLIANFTTTTTDNSPNQDDLTISLTSAQTAAIKAGLYVYDVEIIETSTSKVTRVLEGQLEITPSVSQQLTNLKGIGVDSPSYNISINDTPYRP